MTDSQTPMGFDPLTQPMRDAAAGLGSVASDIKDAAVSRFDDAMTDVRTRAGEARDGVADEVASVADALRRASNDMRGGSAPERTIGTIASSLADVSDQIRDKDLGQIVQMVSKVARDNPMLFLGGAALLGFAASRYAKASGTGFGSMTRSPAHAGPDADSSRPEFGAP